MLEPVGKTQEVEAAVVTRYSNRSFGYRFETDDADLLVSVP